MDSAHWLRVEDVGDGIDQALALPPTTKSRALEVVAMERSRARAMVVKREKDIFEEIERD